MHLYVGLSLRAVAERRAWAAPASPGRTRARRQIYVRRDRQTGCRMSEWRELRDLKSADELAMPSLAHLDNDKPHVGSLLKVIFDHDEGAPRTLRGRNITFVRLVARTIRAYENARNLLIME